MNKFINSYIVFFGFVLSLLLTNVYAAEKNFLTVDELINHGFSQLTGPQLNDLLKEYKIEIRDIETDAVSLSTRTDSDAGNNRQSEGVKSDKPLYFLDTRLIARAPPLEGSPKYRVVADKLVATDGVRTYHITFYEKNSKIFGVRDIDHGNVFFEIVVK